MVEEIDLKHPLTFPRNSNVYYNRGIDKDGLGDYKGAITDYNKVLDLDPKDAKAYNNRGLAKYALGEHQEAYLDWNKAGELGLSKAYELIKEYCKE